MNLGSLRIRGADTTPLAILLIFLGCGELWAGEDKYPPPEEPPLVGQPEHFGGAVGVFKSAAEARPRDLHLGDSTTFILRIASNGVAAHPPHRPDLRRLPKF